MLQLCVTQAIEHCDFDQVDDFQDRDCQQLTFVDAMYFVCITMTTVGYAHCSNPLSADTQHSC